MTVTLNDKSERIQELLVDGVVITTLVDFGADQTQSLAINIELKNGTVIEKVAFNGIYGCGEEFSFTGIYEGNVELQEATQKRYSELQGFPHSANVFAVPGFAGVFAYKPTTAEQRRENFSNNEWNYIVPMESIQALYTYEEIL